MKEVIELNEEWQVGELPTNGRLSEAQVSGLTEVGLGDAGEWLTADMPAQVQDVLLADGRLEDPALPGRMDDWLWVAKKDWVYRKTFPAPETDRSVYLHLKGLDTVVDIYLNGRRVAFHNDLYLPCRVDVTDALDEQNVLLLHFYAPRPYVESLSFPAEWEGKFPCHRLLRKTQEDLGEFLGKASDYTPIGVYDEVCLEVPDTMEIGHLDLRTRLTAGFEKATLTVKAEGTGLAEGARLKLTIEDPDGDIAATGTADVEQGPDDWEAGLELGIEQARLWWPRGYGQQPLYRVTAELASADGAMDRVTKSIGFRDLRMEGEFDFRINGEQVKLWGANLTPLKGRSHVWDGGRCGRLLDLVENADMNALRAWGPGAPYHEELFHEADRRGILIWHDFFHTWGMYPDDDEYRALCRREAEHYVRKLKHHPCILLWCGANETHMGAEMAGCTGDDYVGRVIFEEDYRDVCRRLDPDRHYHPSSPSGGAFANDPLEGDSHSYTHLHYVPGEQHPVFFTENTRTAAPLMKTLRRYLPREDLWPDDFNGVMRTRDDMPMPDSWMEMTLGSEFTFGRVGPLGLFYNTGDTPEGLIYRLGAAQGHYIRNYVERYRRGRPATDPAGRRRTMGHFWWKLNATWPQIYSELIDYYLEPNMGYYFMRRAYRPLLVSIEVGDHIHVWVVNDTGETVRGSLVVQLYDILESRAADELRRDVEVEPGRSEPITNLDEFTMFPRRLAIYARLLDEDGNPIARSCEFAEVEGRLRFPEARLKLAESDGLLTVTADAYARCVELRGDGDGDEFGWLFQDNFFDLFPDETKEVHILGRHHKGRITAHTQFSPHVAEVNLG